MNRLKWFGSMCFFALLTACSHVQVPERFSYRVINTSTFAIASWQKVTDRHEGFHVYIEGDGYAYNAHGRVSSDPTPHDTVVRKIAFSDSYPNVIYLARPCQYVQNEFCQRKNWSTARFSATAIDSTAQALKSIVGTSEVTLIGFSGGAQVAGLVAVTNPEISVKKLITIAGNLDHEAWTKKHRLLPLTESLNLKDYRDQYLRIPQIHYVGMRDNVIQPELVEDFVLPYAPVVRVKDANHSKGWETILNSLF